MNRFIDSSAALVGVVHLPALPGAPRFRGDLPAVIEGAVHDAQALTAAGFDAVLLENFGDAPFFRGRVPTETVSAMTAVAAAVRGATRLPLGINVLRNDAQTAMVVAHVVGAQFIRVNVLVGARVTDQGIVESESAELLRLRDRLRAHDVRIVADVDVKHSRPLGPVEADAVAEEALECVERAMADVVVVTGARTGSAADASVCERVARAVPETPVWLGSGVTADTLRAWLAVAQGVIVGSALRADGRAGGPVDLARARAFVAAKG